MFRWFETRIATFPDAPPARPPETLLALYSHFVRPIWPVFAILLVAGLLGSLIEVALLAFVGSLVDMMRSAQSPAHGGFYPPDAAETGVDLAALVVVRVPNAAASARAAERLLRSGAFGLVVIDLGLGDEQDLSMAQQGRLVTLAQAHDAAVVCLTEKSAEATSLGSLVSVRAEAVRTGQGELQQIEVRALKDKRRGPGWSRATKVRGPAGM